jgi:anti-sigma B factor antagonist
MGLKERTVEGVAVLEVSGRFDAHMAPGVAAWLLRVAEAPPGHAAVDLSNATFIDSAALTGLVSGMKRCRQVGGDLHLCGLGGPVQVIFELTRLNKAFSIYPGVAEAVAAHQAGGGQR